MTKVRELAEQTGSRNLSRRGEFLYCEICGSEMSANKDDYWNATETHVFTCCHVPMKLATKETIITILN
mgnify:CR=1 FL=1